MKKQKVVYNTKPDPITSVKEIRQDPKNGEWEIISFTNGKQFKRNKLTREYLKPERNN